MRRTRCFIPLHERRVCLRVACRQGRRERLRAGSCRASFRGDRDHDDQGEDAEGEGAEQHRLDFCRGSSDGYASEPSGGVRLDVTGTHQHHQLDHLIHLVVPLKQAEFGDATGMEELTAEDRWLLPPFCFFQLHRQVRLDVCFSRHVVRRCA